MLKPITAEIITIGDEILIGQIIDTNAAFLGKTLNSIGVSVYQITSIQDDAEHILKALKEAEANADVVIITGGLGPTKDDITKTTLTTYFNDELRLNKDVLKHIKAYWAQNVNQPLLEVNKSQALLPTKAIPLKNNLGTAPGMWLKHNDTIFVSMPGVPYEMRALMINEVVPRLQQTFKLPGIVHKTLLTYGIGESLLADRIQNWQTNLPKHIKLAYLPSFGKVRLRLSAKGDYKEELEEAILKQINAVMPSISDVFVGFEDDAESIELVIGKHLTANRQTLSLAESFTGGYIAQQITQYPGVSSFFKGGVVTYATSAKHQILGIDKEILNTNSVVSKVVAEQMALKAKAQFEANYAIATTGNAGPTTVSDNIDTLKVGDAIIAIASPLGVRSEIFNFGTYRERVIKKAAHKAFEMLLEDILKNQ